MITEDATTLMRQAPITAKAYLMETIKCIDNELGQGYAKEHPDLVAAFMHISGQDFTMMAILAQAIGDAERPT